MKVLTTVCSLLLALSACSQGPSKNKENDRDIRVGGQCEGCEAIYESPVPFDQLNETDTLPGFNEPGPKIEISGIIYQRDGKTPARDVILYVYHTDQRGIYPTKVGEKGWEKRHGYIRGWVKTNEKGEYRFYTHVPASYPNTTIQKHIHPTIKEPGYGAYWIDEFLFEDDPLLAESEKNKRQPRGSYGVLKTFTENGMLKARRDIILGLNIPGYPAPAGK